jgi:hypothetical protein
MPEITDDAILMVLASELFELEERVNEPDQYELSLT